jgi:TolA-binding protein
VGATLTSHPPPTSPPPARAAVAPAASATSSRPVAPAPAAVPVDAGVEELRVARAKVDAKLYDQALADLKATIARNHSAATTSSAYLIMGGAYDRQGRLDDAMATYVELRSKLGGTPAAIEATILLGDALLRSKRSDREAAARQLFDEVATQHPASEWAPPALARRGVIEERQRARLVDQQLGTSVPTALVTYRTLVQGYPGAPECELALDRLAEMYDTLKRYELAAQSLDELVRRFPDSTRDAAWRAGEIYEKRLRDSERARAAFAAVPQRSSRYDDARKKLDR